MCMADTSTMPSRTPLRCTIARTSSVMRTNSWRCFVLNHRYSYGSCRNSGLGARRSVFGGSSAPCYSNRQRASAPRVRSARTPARNWRSRRPAIIAALVRREAPGWAEDRKPSPARLRLCVFPQAAVGRHTPPQSDAAAAAQAAASNVRSTVHRRPPAGSWHQNVGDLLGREERRARIGHAPVEPLTLPSLP